MLFSERIDYPKDVDIKVININDQFPRFAKFSLPFREKTTSKNGKAYFAKRTKVLYFTDTMNFFKAPLLDLMKVFTPQYVKLKRRKGIFDELRCEIDCKATYEIFKHFYKTKYITENRLSPILTISSLSRYEQLKTFDKKLIDVRRDSYIKKLERKGYRGAIVYNNPLFHNKVIYDLLYLDFNSLYPYAMKNLVAPIKFLEKKRNNHIVSDKQLLYDLCELDKTSMVCISANTVEPSLLYKIPDGRSTISPRDNIVGWYWAEEVKSYLEANKLLLNNISAIVSYQAIPNLLQKFVDKWYKIKQQAKTEIERLIAKLILNSGYGGWGTKRRTNKIIEDYIDPEELNSTTINMLQQEEKYREELGVVYKNTILNEEAFGCFTPIASRTTSKAREYFVKGLDVTNVVAGDCDSYFCFERPEQLTIGKNLGQLKNENIKKFDCERVDGIFYAKKWYQLFKFGQLLHTTVKGVKQYEENPILPFQEKFMFDKVTTPRESRKLKKEKVEAWVIREVTKELKKEVY